MNWEESRSSQADRTRKFEDGKNRNQIAIQDQPIMSVRNKNFSKAKIIRRSSYPTVHANHDLEILVALQFAKKQSWNLGVIKNKK